MLEIGLLQDPQDGLEKEILRERADVLGRAGNSLSEALKKLGNIEQVIDEQVVYLNLFLKERAEKQDYNHTFIRRQTVEINGQIRKYNTMREYAKLRYYWGC